MRKKCDVPIEKLTKSIDLKKYKFETTADLPALSSVIGQERAVSSINFALEIGDSGYNIFVTGSYGTGRTTIVTDLLNKTAQKKPVPSDMAFIFNFTSSDEPIALEFPSGEACKFRNRFQKLIDNLSVDLRKAFESKGFSTRKSEIVEKAQSDKNDIYYKMEKEALELSVQIKSSSMGFVTVPLKDGKPIESEDFNLMPEAEKDKINENIAQIQKRIQDTVRQITLIDRSLQEELDQLNSDVAQFVVENHFLQIREQYKKYPDITEYLDNVAKDITENVGQFIVIDDGNEKKAAPSPMPYKLDKYLVNVVIDNGKKKGAPVIYETNPTYNNLFGRIEKKTFQGYVFTDYTMIRAGSLLSANGGYLILDAEQLFRQPFAYDALKRALRSGKARIEDVYESYGYSTTTALRPSSVQLNVKVILIGSARIYRILHSQDEEFRKIFKVRADFDYEVKESPKTIEQYIQFISRVVSEENLKHFNREGVAAIIEHGFRIADHQNKVSIQFGEIVKIIREASFWAKKSRNKIVSRRDVQKAIESRIYRHDLVEEKVHDSFVEQTINVDVDGVKVGQINGLAVYSLGDYAFGRPSRITINTFIGSKGIVNIEREAKLSGRIHDKGVLVLNGYFSQKFGTKMPLAFSATITFEQSYGMIDGDSASSTELYGLLSSLSGVPINQGIAVTGSVNQKGEVQAIGGVNEKIEGFYKICKTRRLTGKQGVIIPKSNVKNLLLNAEVVKAVKSKKFNIWAVDHIEDGIQILTGENCGIIHKDGTYTKDSIFEKVRQRLVEFARTAQSFRKSLSEENKKDEKENED